MSAALTRSIRGVRWPLGDALAALADAEAKSMRDPDSEAGRRFMEAALQTARVCVREAEQRLDAIHISTTPDRPRAAAGGRGQ